MTAGWYYRALTWVGDHPDTRQVAEQLKERRVIRGVPRPLGVSKFPGGVVTLEWRAGIGTYARAALGMGAQAWVVPVSLVPDPWSGYAEMSRGSPARCDVLLSSLTQDHTGLELKLFAREIGQRTPAIFVCDAPDDLNVESFVGPLVEKGWALVD